jgi:ribosomal protein S18 acetylase RimI-like enzyme
MSRSRSREWASRLTALRARLFEVVETTVLARELDRPVPAHPAGSRLEIVQLAPGRPAGVVLPPKASAHVRPFLARGDTGLVALDDGRPVGWIWLSRVSHRDPWSGLVIRLAPDEAYAYDLWTRPEARQAGAGPALVGAMLREAQAEPGLIRVYGWVDRRNRESQILLRMLGFRDVQTVRRVHVLRRRGWMVRGSDHGGFGPLSEQGRHSTYPEGTPKRVRVAVEASGL